MINENVHTSNKRSYLSNFKQIFHLNFDMSIYISYGLILMFYLHSTYAYICIEECMKCNFLFKRHNKSIIEEILNVLSIGRYKMINDLEYSREIKSTER